MENGPLPSGSPLIGPILPERSITRTTSLPPDFPLSRMVALSLETVGSLSLSTMVPVAVFCSPTATFSNTLLVSVTFLMVTVRDSLSSILVSLTVCTGNVVLLKPPLMVTLVGNVPVTSLASAVPLQSRLTDTDFPLGTVTGLPSLSTSSTL
ncbi:hypothetical protein D3C77_594760 [compost metagenome]